MLDKILVVSVRRCRRPFELAVVHVVRAKQQLHALVRHRPDREELPRESSARRQRPEEQQVGHETIVVRHLSPHSAAEQSNLCPDFPLTRSFVLEVRVSEHDVVHKSRASRKRELRERDELRVRVQDARLRSRPSQCRTETEIVQQSRLVVSHDIRRREFREYLPPLGRRKRRRRVVSDGRVEEELVVPRYVLLAKEPERSQLDLSLSGGVNRAGTDEISNRRETVRRRGGRTNLLIR